LHTLAAAAGAGNSMADSRHIAAAAAVQVRLQALAIIADVR
jgi:hypothetical protein